MISVELISIVASLLAIIGSIYAALKWGRNFLRRLWHLLTRHRSKVPRETMRIVLQKRTNYWNVGAYDGQPAMQIHCSVYVTNITETSIQILDSYIAHPRTHALAITGGQRKQDITDGCSIGPRATANIDLMFFVQPLDRQVGQDFKASLVLIDQFGNEHVVKKIIFENLVKE